MDDGTDGVPDITVSQIVAVISAGENQTLQSCYTVPAGYNAFMTNNCVSNTTLGGANAIDFRQRKVVEGGASRTQSLSGIAAGDSLCTIVNPPKLFTEKTDIEVTGSGTTQAATATFGLVLIKNTLSGL